jgi:hypothetical protein
MKLKAGEHHYSLPEDFFEVYHEPCIRGVGNHLMFLLHVSLEKFAEIRSYQVQGIPIYYHINKFESWFQVYPTPDHDYELYFTYFPQPRTC